MKDSTTLSISAPTLTYCIMRLPLKRIFDVVFSLSTLVLASPLFLIIALIVGCTSKGKIIYYQTRIGRGGVPFRCYKFRTMYADADNRLKELLKKEPCKRAEWQRFHKLKHDPRVTPIGNFLRRTSLDDLPQFWNVLIGDLSVVGPRPVVQEELDKHFGVKAYKILSIRPGLTGIWQVSGRNDMSYQTRIKLDEQYVEERSFLLDLKLIIQTIPCMIWPKGAY